MRSMTSDWTRSFVLIAIVLMLSSGCALIEPRLSPNKEDEKKYIESPTLEHAVKLAESLRTQYLGKAEDLIYWERVTGLTLIGAAALASDLALRSVGASEVIGLGIGGAAVYTGSTWLNSKQQQFIYVAGASAVQCALDAIHPLRVANLRNVRLGQLITDVSADLGKLESILAANASINQGKEEIIRANAIVKKAKSLIPVATDALIVLNSAGGELRTSISSIQTQISNAVIANSPNLQGLVESLGKSLPSLGARIAGVTLPPAQQKGGPSSQVASKDKHPAASTGDTTTLLNLKNNAEKLENKVSEMELIIAAVNAKPTAEKLKNCNVDLKQAGLTMKVVPEGVVSLVVGEGKVALSVSGGVLPYRATWIGQQPKSEQMEMAIETGAGLITLEAKKGAKASQYILLIQDAALGRVPVSVNIVEAPGNQKPEKGKRSK